jgi:hypothetical protein
VLFSQFKANARVKLAKMGHGPRSYTFVVIFVFRLLFLLLYVLFVCKCVLPLADNPNAVNKYIICRKVHNLKNTYIDTDFSFFNSSAVKNKEKDISALW